VPAATQYCTFVIGDLLLGVEVTRVREVFPPRGLTPVPLASPAVRGLINLRGRIVPALDLRGPLGLPPRPDGEGPVNVLVDTAEGPVSLLADQAGDVLRVADADAEAPPQTLAEGARRLIRGACKLERRLLLVLDVEGAVQAAAPADDERKDRRRSAACRCA
jgi:purine-binding chemotaxis protein CheW